ncbi:hypothetical protein KIW84_055350 [Lathyrus oleraceus]|uniref:Uncharacterized protein n=1 Tax=Pisum sativum TaxID=3888 RepID=A0A9D4WYH8_PEA|nr:hypothetical protein KIW84_055350 [Pisum sativum]
MTTCRKKGNDDDDDISRSENGVEKCDQNGHVEGQGKMKTKGNQVDARSEVTYSDVGRSNSMSKGILRIWRLSEIEYYVMLAKVGVHRYNGNNVDLGIACGKC